MPDSLKSPMAKPQTSRKSYVQYRLDYRLLDVPRIMTYPAPFRQYRWCILFCDLNLQTPSLAAQ